MKQNKGVDGTVKPNKKSISTSHSHTVFDWPETCPSLHALLKLISRLILPYHRSSNKKIKLSLSIRRKHIYTSYITLSSALMKLLWLMGRRDQCRLKVVSQNTNELWPRLPFHNEHWHRKHKVNLRSVWLIAYLQ